MVCSIRTIELFGGIWHLRLTLNGEDDEDINRLTLYIRKELGEDNDVFTLGRLLIKME